MEESKERHLIFENEILRSRAEDGFRSYENAKKQEQRWKKNLRLCCCGVYELCRFSMDCGMELP